MWARSRWSQRRQAAKAPSFEPGSALLFYSCLRQYIAQARGSCPALCYPAIVALLLSGLASSAGAATSDAVIRCPDWQAYAPPVVPATAADGQTGERFTARTTPTHTRGQGQGPENRSGPCTHTIRSGDTLGKISAAHLGTARRWPEIARLNAVLDPNTLQIGQVIKLPCAGKPAGAGASPKGAPHADTGPGAGSDPIAGTDPSVGTGFLARLFGGAGAGTARPVSTPADGAGSPSSSGKSTSPEVAQPKTPASTSPVPVTTPAAPPLPVWTAKKGAYLSEVLRRWGKAAGYTVIIDTTDAWRLGVDIKLRASFEDAVDELVSGLAHDGTPPRIRLYPNAVLRLGGPL